MRLSGTAIVKATLSSGRGTVWINLAQIVDMQRTRVNDTVIYFNNKELRVNETPEQLLAGETI